MKFRLIENEPGMKSESDSDLIINKGKSYKLARQRKNQYRKGLPYGLVDPKGKKIPHV